MARTQSTRTTHRIVAEMQEQADARLAQVRTLAHRGLDLIAEATPEDAHDVHEAIQVARQLLTPES